MKLPVCEFLRRFLLHVLPPGFVRIRHFGFLANRRRGTLLPLCLQLLPYNSPGHCRLPRVRGFEASYIPHCEP
jgi:hypothetical protein